MLNEQIHQNDEFPSDKRQPIHFRKMKMAPVQRVFSRVDYEDRNSKQYKYNLNYGILKETGFLFSFFIYFEFTYTTRT